MTKQFNDEVLLRRITADDGAIDLIHRWLNNTDLNYDEFAEILEMADLKGPFTITSSKDSDYWNMLIVTAGEKRHVIWLGFFDTDSSGSLEIIPTDGASYESICEYLVKGNKLQQCNNLK